MFVSKSRHYARQTTPVTQWQEPPKFDTRRERSNAPPRPAG